MSQLLTHLSHDDLRRLTESYVTKQFAIINVTPPPSVREKCVLSTMQIFAHPRSCRTCKTFFALHAATP